MKRIAYEHGLVIGKFYPPHLGHDYLIRTAAAHCRHVTVAVLGSSVESISIADRLSWLRDMFAGEPHVRIFGALDDVPVDYHDPAIWDAHVAIMRGVVRAADRECGSAPAVDAVFTSETYGHELARHFGSAHVCLDQSRALYPVSGTAVRASPVAHWYMLPPTVRAGLVLRVVVIGAESTGTTTLSQDLTRALRQRGGVWARTACVAEFGREYSANLLALARAKSQLAGAADINWQSADFSLIARKQCQLEQTAARHSSPLLICDTDAFATCIWHERYMGQQSADLESVAAIMPPRALYLLTSEEGVAFEVDGLRDGEHLRQWMTARFQSRLALQCVPWLELKGSRQQRCQAALAAVDALLANAWRFALPLG